MLLMLHSSSSTKTVPLFSKPPSSLSHHLPSYLPSFPPLHSPLLLLTCESSSLRTTNDISQFSQQRNLRKRIVSSPAAFSSSTFFR